MQLTRRSLFIYGLLLAVWALIAGWQAAEHLRVRKSARVALMNRGKDISTTLGIVLRSQRRFGVVDKERLESALTGLVKPGELDAIALLNAAGDVVASAGATNELLRSGAGRPAELWEEQTVTLMNLVDLGTSVTQETERTNPPPIILSRSDFPSRGDTNRPPPDFRRGPPPENETNPLAEISSSQNSTNRSGRRGDGGRPRFGRPSGMSETEYKAMLEKQGVHSFVIVMSTEPMLAVLKNDLRMRAIICLLATISVLGSGLAWRNVAKSADLQIRLMRASELNSHLKEMNLAAAGLAHETRNPLNIVRGLAQMISKQEDAPPETRKKSREILDETDRITAQLNEFINYSRPREVRRAPVALDSIVGEVVRTLNFDIEEKKIQIQVQNGALTIEADEQLLRQALFNLVLNATQAVAANGEIRIAARKDDSSEAVLEISDNGPGVPPARRAEIFKPYFTMSQNGTGLGLAVVQQIVLAHGWEIECLPNEPRGALFRITHLKLAAS